MSKGWGWRWKGKWGRDVDREGMRSEELVREGRGRNVEERGGEGGLEERIEIGKDGEGGGSALDIEGEETGEEEERSG